MATAHRNEVGFYRQLALDCHVRVPACWYAAISEDGRVSRFCSKTYPTDNGAPGNGCSFTQATKAVQTSVRLHASRWNDGTLREADFLLPLTEERAAFLADIARTATDQFVARYASELDPEDVLTFRVGC